MSRIYHKRRWCCGRCSGLRSQRHHDQPGKAGIGFYIRELMKVCFFQLEFCLWDLHSYVCVFCDYSLDVTQVILYTEVEIHIWWLARIQICWVLQHELLLYYSFPGSTFEPFNWHWKQVALTVSKRHLFLIGRILKGTADWSLAKVNGWICGSNHFVFIPLREDFSFS